MPEKYPEYIVQLEVGMGADGKPFLTCLSSAGRMFVKWSITSGEWEEMGVPTGLIPF